jgi:hypothetical protein
MGQRVALKGSPRHISVKQDRVWYGEGGMVYSEMAIGARPRGHQRRMGTGEVG